MLKKLLEMSITKKGEWEEDAEGLGDITDTVIARKYELVGKYPKKNKRI